MNRSIIFLVRAVLGVVFAVVLVRMFYPDKPIGYTIALAVFMVGMAYFFEYIRKNKENSGQRKEMTHSFGSHRYITSRNAMSFAGYLHFSGADGE